jgi:hypothetical protein
MATAMRNPGAGHAGARNAIQLVATADTSENKPSLIDFQAQFVSRRYCLPLALAAAIAAIAYDNGRRA